MRRALRSQGSEAHGFTMLELIMAMVIFTFLGLLVVVLMRQGLSIFVQGTRDSILQDRMDTVLPQIERKLDVLALPASFDAPPPPPSEEELMAEVQWTPPPPVDERLRSTYITLRDTPEGPLKDVPCFYAAWVTDIAGNRNDPLLRRAGERPGPGLEDLTPEAVDKAGPETLFKATGGLQEVCYVAVPEDPDFPALLTLYHGFRSPIGGPNSLLDETNLDTLREIRQRCRPIAKGILHFVARWRRVFATDWEPTTGKVGEHDSYVGWRWDSTRALDKKFPLFKDPSSLGDPSDDVFPAWGRLEITLIAPTTLGYGRGETALMERLSDDDRLLVVEDTRPLLGPGPDDRWLKVDAEWMQYRASRVDAHTGRVPVERGRRGTKATSHEADADLYVGLYSQRDLRLLFRDRYARARGRRP